MTRTITARPGQREASSLAPAERRILAANKRGLAAEGVPAIQRSGSGTPFQGQPAPFLTSVQSVI